MAVVVSADLEVNSLAQFTATDIGATGTLAATTGSAHDGSYGAHATINDSGGTSQAAAAYKTFSVPASHHVRAEAWVRFTAFTSGGFNNSGSRGPLSLIESGASDDRGGKAAWLSLVGTRTLQAFYADHGGTKNSIAGTVAMTLNTWYLLRLEYDWSTSTSRVVTFSYSTDGATFTQVGTATDTTWGSGDGALGAVGVITGIAWNGTFENGNYAVDVDTAAVYDAAAGGALAAGITAVGALTTSQATVSLAFVQGGTAPYSNQLQRAPDVAGSPGTWANTGSPISGPDVTFTDTGLSANTKYWWRTVTTDAVPNNVTSNQVSATTAGNSAPSAPTIGVAVAGDGMATVYWTPASNGGSAFTAWRIIATPAPSGGQPADITTFPTTRTFAPVVGLTNATAYTFTVTGINAIGTGTASGSSNSVTPTAEVATWAHDAANPQRTSHIPTEPAEPWSFAWAFNGPDSPADLTKHLYDAPPDARSVSDGGTRLFVPAGDQGIYAFTLATGAQLWHLTGYTIRCSPVYDPTSGSLIACSLDGNLLKINPATGAISARYFAGAKLRRSPLVAGAYVYAVNDLGQMVKLTISDFSTVVWTGTPGSGTWTALTSPTAGVPAATTPPSYSAASDCLVFGTSDLYVRCIKNSDGTQLWAVKPANTPAASDPYSYEGGWPVIAEQHKIVLMSMQLLHAEMGNYDAALGIGTNAQARTYVNASAKQCLFALNLADGSSAFVPAVGYGSVEGIRGGSTYGQAPSQMPVIYVSSDGVEVALCQFRTNVSTPPDYRWDGHMGMMVLDAVTASGYSPGDLMYVEMDSFANNAGGGLVTGKTSYSYIVDERSLLTMAGATLMHHHWGALESVKLGSAYTPSSGHGGTTADPIQSTAHKPIMRDLRNPSTGIDSASHYSTAGTLQLVEDSRTWVGPGWTGYYGQSCPPAGLLEPSSFSSGLRPNHGFVVGQFLVVVDNSGGIMVLGHQTPVANASDVAWTGPTSGPAGAATSGFKAQLKPLGSHAAASVVVTPGDGGAGGTFSPTSATLTDTNPVGAFSYTPASAATGTKTLTAAANNGSAFGTSPTISFLITGTGGSGGGSGTGTGQQVIVC